MNRYTNITEYLNKKNLDIHAYVSDDNPLDENEDGSKQYMYEGEAFGFPMGHTLRGFLREVHRCAMNDETKPSFETYLLQVSNNEGARDFFLNPPQSLKVDCAKLMDSIDRLSRFVMTKAQNDAFTADVVKAKDKASLVDLIETERQFFLYSSNDGIPSKEVLISRIKESRSLTREYGLKATVARLDAKALARDVKAAEANRANPEPNAPPQSDPEPNAPPPSDPELTAPPPAYSDLDSEPSASEDVRARSSQSGTVPSYLSSMQDTVDQLVERVANAEANLARQKALAKNKRNPSKEEKKDASDMVKIAEQSLKVAKAELKAAEQKAKKVERDEKAAAKKGKGAVLTTAFHNQRNNQAPTNTSTTKIDAGAGPSNPRPR